MSVRVEVIPNARLTKTRILATRKCERKGPFFSDREILGAWHLDENPVAFHPWKPGAKPEDAQALTMHPEVLEKMRQHLGSIDDHNVARLFV